MYTELSVSAQNAYADLFDAVSAVNLSDAMRGLNGSFAKKAVKGKRYWYFQYRDLDGGIEQVYIGPESERVNTLIARHQSLAGAGDNIQKLTKAAIALGCDGMLAKHFRAIRRLSEYGFFRRGGILVGTHAFMAMGNMLGISASEKMQTQDVDFAHAGKNISIALPSTIKIDTHRAIESLEMGLLPIASVEGKQGATYINPSSPDFRIDFLTSKSSESDAPVFIEGLSIALQPLKFMEFSMEKSIQALAMSQEGAVLVNIPSPERYAVHKLIVSAERPVTESAKIRKDIRQACVLIRYYINSRPDELRDAYVEASNNGPGWRSRLSAGVKNLAQYDAGAADFFM